MLQDFRRRTKPEDGPPRLAALRRAMEAAGVDAFLVPRADAHRGETVTARDERLAWLTGFAGSAGFAAVTAERAAVFVDGRYRLQVRAEVDGAAFEALDHSERPLGEWLAAALPEGGRVGFDPWLHTPAEIEGLERQLGERVALARCDNLVDRIWEDQPPPPSAPVRPHPEAIAGRSAAAKRDELARGLAAEGVAAAVLTLPDSIAWLLNIRGGDIRHTPVTLAFAILHASGRVDLFVAPEKVDAEAAAHLAADVTVRAPDAFGPALDGLSGRVALDRNSAPVWVADRLQAAGVELAWSRDPCLLPKARKNEAELAGARAAHLRDGAALADFLAWLDGAAPAGGLTEIDVIRRLEECRRATGELRDIAFDTICGAGPNGAVVHYRVNEETNRTVRPGELLLIDSGGQYLDGTTDVTRTVAIGAPDERAIRPFTLVLKGMIAIARLRWPEGLAGRDLDAAARLALWRAGLDYDHGTGHGVGAFLSVHEGPAALSRRSAEPLRPGMILSDEPGYYREGAFGIRIENLLAVTPPETPAGGDRPMLGFETLTLAPIDRRLIEPALLDAEERAWLDAYHARVLRALEERVRPETRGWLRRACRPLAAGDAG
jgi:Xaa-Pro aminopeptidase